MMDSLRESVLIELQKAENEMNQKKKKPIEEVRSQIEIYKRLRKIKEALLRIDPN